MATFGESLARAQLLESLNIHFPNADDVGDGALDIYIQMAEGANRLIDECCELKRELDEYKCKLNCMSRGFNSIADEECGDVVFQLKQGVTRAHSSVVSSWSAPLAAMLQPGMREGSTKCITITTEEPVFVRMMLKYCYTAQALIDASSVFPLLRLSCLYAIDYLRDQCCEYLQHNITVENCMEIVAIADLHLWENLPIWSELASESEEYAIANFPTVLAVNNSPFNGMSVIKVAELLDGILDIWDLEQNDNAGLAQAVVNWAKGTWHIWTLPHLIMHINSAIASYKMQLFVKISGTTVSMFVEKTSTICDLKEVLERSTGIPKRLQRLTFEGRVVNNTESLAECKILTDCTVHLSVAKQPEATPTATSHSNKSIELICLSRLYQICISILQYDFATQSRTPAFLELDCDTLMVIVDDDLHCRMNVVIDALHAWLNASPNRSATVIAKLLTHPAFDCIDFD